MLGAVVLKDPADLLHAAAQGHVPYQDKDLDKPFDEGKNDAGAHHGTQQRRKAGGDKDEQHRR